MTTYYIEELKEEMLRRGQPHVILVQLIEYVNLKFYSLISLRLYCEYYKIGERINGIDEWEAFKNNAINVRQEVLILQCSPHWFEV